jgi:hypothetical protein
MKLALALSAVLSLASNAYAGCPKEWANPPPPNNVLQGLDNFFKGFSPGAQQREEAAKATYRALLQAGAPEETAC